MTWHFFIITKIYRSRIQGGSGKGEAILIQASKEVQLSAMNYIIWIKPAKHHSQKIKIKKGVDTREGVVLYIYTPLRLPLSFPLHSFAESNCIGRKVIVMHITQLKDSIISKKEREPYENITNYARPANVMGAYLSVHYSRKEKDVQLL